MLVWGGGHGDDLAKSPHMARIGNSVYHDICPNDPTCSQFGFYSMPDRPTPMMANSLLFNLIQNGIHKVIFDFICFFLSKCLSYLFDLIRCLTD